MQVLENLMGFFLNLFTAFVVWAKEELEMFVNTFNRHVFGGKSTLTVISECVQTARQHCDGQVYNFNQLYEQEVDLVQSDSMDRVLVFYSLFNNILVTVVIFIGGHRDRDGMVVAFTITSAISAYHH
jgi:hypothetical protein